MDTSQKDDAFKLQADAYVDLYTLTLNTGAVVNFKGSDKFTYLGVEYEALECGLDGWGFTADDQVSRPKLNVVNPEGIFSAFVAQGVLDRAKVVLTRVLRQDMENQVGNYTRYLWYVSRVVTLNRNSICMELRGYTDNVVSKVPYRVFCPPDFPLVSLS